MCRKGFFSVWSLIPVFWPNISICATEHIWNWVIIHWPYIYTYTHTQTYSFIHLRIHILLSPLILWMLRYFWKWFYYANFLYLWKTKLIQHFKQLRNFYLIQVQKSTCIYFVICRFNLKKKINTTKEWMKLVLKQKRGTQRHTVIFV